MSLCVPFIGQQSANLQEVYDTAVRENGGRLPSVINDPIGLKDFGLIRNSVPQLMVAITIFAVGVFTNCLSQAWLQLNFAKVYDKYTDLILWDAGFEHLPALPPNWIALPDYFAAIALCGAVVRLVVLPGPMSMRWTIARRGLFLYGIIYSFRAFSIVSTILPNPDATCTCQYGDHECTMSELEDLWMFAAQIFSLKAGTCADVLFSGHTVAITISLLFLMEYTQKAPWFVDRLRSHTGVSITAFNASCVIYAAISYICIIGSHFHYTADVFVGFLLSLLVFKGYHQAIKAAHMDAESFHPPNMFIRWFEKDALDVKVWHKLAVKRLEICQHGIDVEAATDVVAMMLLNPRTNLGWLIAHMQAISNRVY